MATYTTTLGNFMSLLRTLPDNTVETYYTIKITGITESDCSTFGTLHMIITYQAPTEKPNVYFSLWETEIPECDEFRYTFNGAKTMVIPPRVLKARGISGGQFHYTFKGCTNLIKMPYCLYIQSYCLFKQTFYGCSKLTSNSESYIDFYNHGSGSISLEETFAYCTSLRTFYGNNLIYNQFTMDKTFIGCTALQRVTNLGTSSQLAGGYFNQTFKDCTSLTETPSNLANTDGYFLYKTFENCTSLVTAPTISKCKNGYIIDDNNQSVYVDYDLIGLYKGCTSLRTVTLPTNAKGLMSTFEGCTSLTSTPTIPSSVTELNGTFKGCTGLRTSTIPNTVTSLPNTYEGSGLITQPTIPSSVTTLDHTFKGCTSLTSINIPSNVTNLNGAYENCTALTTVPSMHDALVQLTEAFKGCSALTTINNFRVPKTVLTQNAENCFAGCTNLATINVPNDTPIIAQESTDWHVFRLKFGASTVEGKVYDKTGNATNIAQTSITKSTLKLLIKTDELWFPSGYTDAQIDAIILKAIQYRYTYFNKDVIPPDEKSFVMYADDPSKVISNIPAFNYTGYCSTAGATQAKICDMSGFKLVTGTTFLITFKNTNTYNGKITLNVNGTGAKDVYLNGSVTSSTNKTINAGTYLCWYSGSVYYIDTGWEVYRSRLSLITGRASYLQTFSCTTASATVAKVVSHFGYSLSTRSEILVYFSNTNTATNPTLNVNGTGAKAIKIYGVQPNSTNNLLVAGTYRGFYDGTYWNLEPYGTTNEVASNNMQSVTSNAVANYARQNLYVDCNMNGTNILVTNNLHRTDLKIEGIGFKGGSTYSYFFITTLNETESEQTITSYNGRQLSEYNMCMINIYQDNNCIGSGIIANVVANQMSIRVHC